MERMKKKMTECAGCVTKPCQVGCPLHNDIPSMMALMKKENYQEAYELLCQTTVLPSICGRICPHERQCQGSCVKRISYQAVQIGKIEAFLGDLAIKNHWKIPKESSRLSTKKVAVIGSGPAGLTCAAFLAKNGCHVTLYEQYEKLGGILAHGIPEFRLKQKKLKEAIDQILALEIKVEKNQTLGKEITLKELENRYDAVFLGVGANVSANSQIEGEHLSGIYGGNELLEKNLHPDYTGKKVAIIGGGNVAIDTARVIQRKGAKSVTILYRRAKEQMPAEKKELKEAVKEGIHFLFQTNLVKVIGREKVEKIECIKTALIQKEGEDRLSPVDIAGSNYCLEMDYVIMAIGSKVDESMIEKCQLSLNGKGRVKVDQKNQITGTNVFAGGDVIGALGTVAGAAMSGRKAAYAIMEFLTPS